MLQTWINLHRYVKKPLLMGMLHDQAAVRFENMTDNDIIENGRINRELRLTENLCCFCSIVNITFVQSKPVLRGHLCSQNLY
jgi:hypothetical protein